MAGRISHGMLGPCALHAGPVVTGLALHTLMQGTATTARYTKRYVQVD